MKHAVGRVKVLGVQHVEWSTSPALDKISE